MHEITPNTTGTVQSESIFPPQNRFISLGVSLTVRSLWAVARMHVGAVGSGLDSRSAPRLVIAYWFSGPRWPHPVHLTIK